jgi:hypothetical protein
MRGLYLILFSVILITFCTLSIFPPVARVSKRISRTILISFSLRVIPELNFLCCSFVSCNFLQSCHFALTFSMKAFSLINQDSLFGKDFNFKTIFFFALSV